MNTCQTCHYWVPIDEDHYLRPLDPDTYDPMPQPFTIGQCGSPSLLFHEWPTDPRQAVLLDGSGYYAGLYPGPEFGCVAWKAIKTACEMKGEEEPSSEEREKEVRSYEETGVFSQSHWNKTFEKYCPSLQPTYR